MNDQRKDERVSCLVPIEAKKNDSFDRTKTIDFSKGGIGLISAKEIKLDEKITIELDLDEEGDPVFVVGKVQWVRPLEDTGQYRVGLTFDSISKGSQSRLDQYFQGHKTSGE